MRDFLHLPAPFWPKKTRLTGQFVGWPELGGVFTATFRTEHLNISASGLHTHKQVRKVVVVVVVVAVVVVVQRRRPRWLPTGKFLQSSCKTLETKSSLE